MCVHQSAGGGENTHATTRRTPKPGVVPSALSERISCLLHDRQSGRTRRAAEGTGTGTRVSVRDEWDQTGLLLPY